MKRSLLSLALVLVSQTALADPPAAPSAPVGPSTGTASTAAAPVAAPPQYPYGYAPYGYGYPPPYGYGYAPPGYGVRPASAAPKLDVRTEPYHGGPVPDNAKVVTKRPQGLLIAGGVTLGALYFASVIYALSACPPGKEANDCPSNSGWLYVPVIGPFATAADSNASFGGRNLAIFDGVLQLAGTAAVIYAFAASKEVLEIREPASASSGQTRQTASVRVAPIAAGASVGATIIATAF